MYVIRKGLNLPITGAPDQKNIETVQSPTAALLGHDYHGLKPQVLVEVGDKVLLGQPLFRNKANPDIIYGAPAAGQVIAINRGIKRSLQSVVVRLEDNQQQIKLPATPKDAQSARQFIIESGLWTSLRTRPFSLVPEPDVQPFAVFINAMDSNPLAADPEPVITARSEDFIQAIEALNLAFECKIFVCHKRGAKLPVVDKNNVTYAEFSGKHPAGNVGTHMHMLAPVGRERTNIHLNYQDTLAIGKLFSEGIIDNSRQISLAGPQVKNPRILKTILGADIEAIIRDEVDSGETRIISGSVLNGRRAEGGFAWLGRYHLQISALAEGRERHFLHYVSLGANRFSVMPVYLSKLVNKLYNFTTSTNGSERAMVPIGAYERVMPFKMLPTQLLRSLIVGDIETAEQLGCLELDEEDLSLCTFVCPGKYEYAPILRENLTTIQKEG